MEKRNPFFLAVAACAVALIVPGAASAAWVTEDFTLFASNGVSGDQFGTSVAIDGNYAVVGAGSRNSAYVYEYDGTSWIEEAQLSTASAPSSVDIFGDTAVVGASGGNTASVFQRDGGGNWNQVATLGSPFSDSFGNDVAIDGDTIVVGACDYNNKAGGAAVYYRNEGGTNNWGRVTVIPAATGAYGRTGWSVDVDEDQGVIVLGAGRWNGSAFIYYSTAPGAWPTSPDTQVIHGRGDQPVDVSIDGTRLVLGCYGRFASGGNQGLDASIWDFGEDWTRTGNLTSPNYGTADAFGSAVAVEGDKVIIGAPLANSYGEAYVYELNEAGYWVDTDVLTTTSGNSGDGVGTSVALSGDVTILGGPFVDGSGTDVGAAFIYGSSNGGGGDLEGDLNGDGVVSSADLDLIRGNWGTSNPAGDANKDGFVNSSDLDIVRANWGATAAAAVPEPGTVVLLAVCGVLLAAVRRR